jgi:hypothetical protein
MRTLLPAIMAILSMGCFAAEPPATAPETAAPVAPSAPRKGVPISGITFNKGPVLALGANEIVTLEATVAPATATNPAIVWSVSNGAVLRLVELPGLPGKVVLCAQKPGKVMLRAMAADSSGKSAEIAVAVSVPATAKDAPLQPYFGELHCHTAVSDGRGRPADAFAKARDKMDFLGVSDHWSKIDMAEWYETVKAAETASDGKFLALADYEAGFAEEHLDSFKMKVVDGGEIVMIGTPEMPYPPKDDKIKDQNPQGLTDFQARFRGIPTAVGMFAHPQEAGWPTEWVWNCFSRFQNRNDFADRLIRLIEVGNATSAYERLFEDSYALALDNGWHVSPAAVSDTHAANWGDSPYRTVIWAPALTRHHFFEALRANHVYATRDADTRLKFEVNGVLMGGTLKTPPLNSASPYDLTVTVEDPTQELAKLEVVSDAGAVVYAAEIAGHQATHKTQLLSRTARWFYVRTTNAAGATAISSPVWTGRPPVPPKLLSATGLVRVPKAGWKVTADKGTVAGSAAKLFDGNPVLAWEAAMPEPEAVIDFGKETRISAVGYYRHLIAYEDREAIAKLPRNLEYAVSPDGTTWHSVKTTIRAYGSEWIEELPKPIRVRFLRIRILSNRGGPTAAIGEISVFE